MTRTSRVAAAGATPRTEYPPFGNQTSRAEWTDRLAQISTLADALSLLIEWRASRGGNPLEEADFLWIESRIEDRVAVLRFAELSPEFIETTTLTGEPIAAVTQEALTDARNAVDSTAIELIVAAFRRRYKPPVMPTVPFMRTEVELTELLIRRRSKGWYDEPLDELRRRRAAVVPRLTDPTTPTLNPPKEIRSCPNSNSSGNQVHWGMRCSSAPASCCCSSLSLSKGPSRRRTTS